MTSPAWSTEHTQSRQIKEHQEMNQRPTVLLYNMMITIKITRFKPFYIWQNLNNWELSLLACGSIFLNH